MLRLQARRAVGFRGGDAVFEIRGFVFALARDLVIKARQS